MSVWDGTYTEAQARAGEAIYSSICAECHGEDLAGREQSPALAGLGFVDNWNRATLRQLYDMVQDMPPDEPMTLEPKQYIDVLAYLLSANGFPAGAAALTNDRAALARIRIVNGGPQQ
jgi:mono/diheme cytochrome c family protein